jgi:GTP-binding protein
VKILSADFVCSAVRPDQHPRQRLPGVAFAGRSNVGKSSLINKLVNRKALAKISAKPGKTATLNFFIVNAQMYLVDLPGYGYAKVSKAEKEAWGRMIERFLNTYEDLKGLVMIVDLRHPPTPDDQQMYRWAKEAGVPVVVAATKADKLKRSEIDPHVAQVWEGLGMEHFPEDELIPVSAESGLNRERLWTAISRLTSL